MSESFVPLCYSHFIIERTQYWAKWIFASWRHENLKERERERGSFWSVFLLSHGIYERFAGAESEIATASLSFIWLIEGIKSKKLQLEWEGIFAIWAGERVNCAHLTLALITIKWLYEYECKYTRAQSTKRRTIEAARINTGTRSKWLEVIVVVVVSTGKVSK